MRRIDLNSDQSDVGFQIAPMIDVVFVIMLFFMVMAGAVKVEKELNSQLPGNAPTSEPTDFVNEQIISIANDGQVSLNDEPLDHTTGHALPQLRDALLRAKQIADNSKSKCLVTIISSEDAKYSRCIDVLDALSVAKITNVTFTVGDNSSS